MRCCLAGAGYDQPVADFIRPALYLDEDLRLEIALRRMQRSGQRMAIVLGRDRREIGIVTLDDILKVIFGEVVSKWTGTLIISVGWKIVAVLVLVLLNGFFVAAEFALVNVRDTQLAPLIHKGNRRGESRAIHLERLDSFLSAAQLGITLASLGLGWIGEPVFSALLIRCLAG